MKKVLITGAGGAAAVSIYKSLVNNDVEIFMADMCSKAPGLYLVDKAHRVILPEASNKFFADKLAINCKDLAIDVLFPTVDMELLPIARKHKTFVEHGTYVAITTEKSLDICLDKYLLMQTCEEHIPLSRYSIFDENFNENDWEYPLIVKPRSGSGSRDISLVRSKNDLRKMKRNKDYLVQDYLPGQEYSVDVYVDSKLQCIAAVPRERIKVDSGVAVVSKTLLDKSLINLAKKAAIVTGLKGVANIQFKRDLLGVPKLLEINPRFSGTMPLTIAAGVDMPKMVMQEACNEVLFEVQHKELAVVRYLQEKFISVSELN